MVDGRWELNEDNEEDVLGGPTHVIVLGTGWRSDRFIHDA